MRRTIVLFALVLLACRTSHIAELQREAAKSPENGQVWYVLAVYQARAHDPRGAAQSLEHLEHLGWTHGVDLTELGDLAGDPHVSAVATRLNAAVPRVHRSETFLTIPQRQLSAEGIAFDPVSGTYFLSSIRERKVIAVDAHGVARDVVAEGQEGLLGTLGLKVDATRRLLWIASEADPDMHGFGAANRGHSLVAVVDLRTGAIVRKIAWGDAKQPSLANDLALLDDGSVYVTDSEGGGVMRIAPGHDVAEAFIARGTFRYPNGIAIAPDQRHLYVADSRGVTVVDLHDHWRKPLAIPSPRDPLAGIDGMSVHNGALIAIQNGSGQPRVIRALLNESLERVTKIEVLESGNPDFASPTTGTVVGDSFVYMANPLPGDGPLVILRVSSL